MSWEMSMHLFLIWKGTRGFGLELINIEFWKLNFGAQSKLKIEQVCTQKFLACICRFDPIKILTQ